MFNGHDRNAFNLSANTLPWMPTRVKIIEHLRKYVLKQWHKHCPWVDHVAQSHGLCCPPTTTFAIRSCNHTWRQLSNAPLARRFAINRSRLIRSDAPNAAYGNIQITIWIRCVMNSNKQIWIANYGATHSVETIKTAMTNARICIHKNWSE